MSCVAPLKGWASKKVNPKTGLRSITFDVADAFFDLPREIPCGQCFGCRLKRKGDWATRIEKEAMLFEQNCFLTLTFHDAHLPTVFSPVDGVERSTVEKDVLSSFIERLRDAIRDDLAHQLQVDSGLRPKKGRRGAIYNLSLRLARRQADKTASQIRFYGCGEYGEAKGRAHYHVAIFGWDCVGSDVVGSSSSRSGFKWSMSKIVSKAWPFGHHTVMALNWQTGAYIAGYIGKAITGLGADAAYDAHGIGRPFQHMSRMPGIGRYWLEHFSSDVYPSGQIVLHGGKVRSPPVFFDKVFVDAEPALAEALKSERRKRALARSSSESVHADSARQGSHASRARRRDVGGVS